MKRLSVMLALTMVLGGLLAGSAHANIINPFTGELMNNLLVGIDPNTPTPIVVDNRNSLGWLDDGVGKHFHFQANFDKGQVGSLTLFLYYFSENTDFQPFPPVPPVDGLPGLNNTNGNGGHWISLGSRTIELYPENFVDEIDLSAQINGFQPFWDAVYVKSVNIRLTSWDLETYCKPPPAPIPGSLVLLGSGIIGLVGVCMRRRSS